MKELTTILYYILLISILSVMAYSFYIMSQFNETGILLGFAGLILGLLSLFLHFLGRNPGKQSSEQRLKNIEQTLKDIKEKV